MRYFVFAIKAYSYYNIVLKSYKCKVVIKLSRIGSKINRIRVEKGITQKQLGKLVGVSENFVIDVEAGKRVVGDDLIKRISKALGQDLSEETMLEVEEKAGDRKEVVNFKEVKGIKKEPVKAVQEVWSDAFGSVLKAVPVYEYDLSTVIGTRQLPVVSNKVEGHPKEKVLFIKVRDNDMMGFRMLKDDIAFGYLTNEAENNSICLIEYNNRRVVRQLKRLDNEKLLLISNMGSINTETVIAKSIKVLARLEKVEVKL